VEVVCTALDQNLFRAGVHSICMKMTAAQWSLPRVYQATLQSPIPTVPTSELFTELLPVSNTDLPSSPQEWIISENWSHKWYFLQPPLCPVLPNLFSKFLARYGCAA